MSRKIIIIILAILIVITGSYYYFFVKPQRDKAVNTNVTITENTKKVYENVDELDENIKTLDDYFASIDYSCSADSDCAIKNVSDCCGDYIVCVNAKTKVNPNFVQKACETDKRPSSCEYFTINACKCTDNICEGYYQK